MEVVIFTLILILVLAGRFISRAKRIKEQNDRIFHREWRRMYENSMEGDS